MIVLRKVVAADVPLLFAYQQDPEARRIAAVPGRDREAFEAHWSSIMRDETLIARTILVGDRVVGNVLCFGPTAGREVGYWIAREYWGAGIATHALSAFLSEIVERSLYAHVAEHNLGSIRVLEKCGFQRSGNVIAADGVREILFELGAEGVGGRLG
jgi:RimJ/RimL family protein N-acetyltransferase